MNNEYKKMLERFDQICQNAKKELLCEKEEKQNDIRHFILETKDYGNFDVVEYEKYKELQEEINRLNNIIDETTKYVKSLSSSGRGCDIYDDIKKEILNKLKGDNK